MFYYIQGDGVTLFENTEKRGEEVSEAMHRFYSNLHLRKESNVLAMLNEVIKVDYLNEIPSKIKNINNNKKKFSDKIDNTNNNNINSNSSKNDNNNNNTNNDNNNDNNSNDNAIPKNINININIENKNESDTDDRHLEFTPRTISSKRFSMQNSIDDFHSIEQYKPFSFPIRNTSSYKNLSSQRNNDFHSDFFSPTMEKFVNSNSNSNLNSPSKKNGKNEKIGNANSFFNTEFLPAQTNGNISPKNKKLIKNFNDDIDIQVGIKEEEKEEKEEKEENDEKEGENEKKSPLFW